MTKFILKIKNIQHVTALSLKKRQKLFTHKNQGTETKYCTTKCTFRLLHVHMKHTNVCKWTLKMTEKKTASKAITEEYDHTCSIRKPFKQYLLYFSN